MAGVSYSSPVSALLSYGNCLEIDKKFEDPERDRLMEEVMSSDGKIDRAKLAQIKVVPRAQRWPNYVEEVGLTLENVPELLRMVTDLALEEAGEKSLEVWAPVHAWRSLGQLGAEAAIEPLMELFRDRDNEWALEEIPCVLGLIGESAIEPLAGYLAKRRYKDWARVSATESLERIAKTHADLKARCLEVLANQLKDYKRNPKGLNGFFVSSLIELEGVQHAELMEEAYGASRVDETICGTWANVQIDMGLAKEEDFTPEELELPRPEWAEKFFAQREHGAKPTARELGLPTKRPENELSMVYGEGKLPFGKKRKKAAKVSKGFGQASGKAEKKQKKSYLLGG